MTTFVTEYRNNHDIIDIIKDKITKDLSQAFTDVKFEEGNSLMDTLLAIAGKTGEKFIMINDEWDAILREFTNEQGIVTQYIDMNHEGLKDDIIRMLAGERCHVDTTGFTNDMNEVKTKDDVFTVLIHLGYLTYS